jgi:hypothetical protein
MKTTIYKKTEVDISPEEVVRNIINDLEHDRYAITHVVQNYLIEELPDFVYDATEEYNPTNEEFNEVTKLILPKLKKLYNNRVAQLKESELRQLSNKQNILDWLDRILYNATEYEPGFWLNSEEILSAILENGTKSRF